MQTRLLRRATVILVIMLCVIIQMRPAQAQTGGYPYASYNGPGSNAAQGVWTDENGQTYSSRYRFAYRNCTDFVAWKLDSANGWYVGVTMGHAKEWKAWALARNYVVDTNPAQGAVAWWTGSPANGNFGHVAWVESVVGDNVLIQEYNTPFGSGAFASRTIAKTDPTGYIHFKDLESGGGGTNPPQPTLNTPVLAAASRSSGEQFVFWRGPDNNLWESWWAPSTSQWYGPVSLGFGPLGSPPTVAVNPITGQVNVFWKGGDGRLWQAFYAGQWYGPIPFAGTALGSTPTATAHGHNVTVFWKGADNNLWQMWWNGSQWYGPISLGFGPLGSAPAAAANPQGEQVVFWRGTDGYLWEAWYASGSWHGPALITYGVASAPTVTIRPNNEVQVFWKGTNGQLWQAFYSNGWYGPFVLGMGPLGSAPAATSWGTEVNVFWRGTDNNWWEAWYSSGWHGPVTAAKGPIPPE